MDGVLAAYWAIPPITRTFATAVFSLSLCTILQILPEHWFIFHPYFLFKFPPQIWRLVTSFLLAGSGLNLLFDTYFIYNYMAAMERGNPRFPRREDLIWYLMFVGGTIMTINYIFQLPFMSFLSGLIVALAYTITQEQAGMKTQYFFITIPAQLVPYCMTAMNLLFPGGVYVIPLYIEGLVAAHLYHFLANIWPKFSGTDRNLIPTPAFLTTVVNTVEGWISPRPGASTGRAASGPLPESWRSRGPGQRLG